ncbi:MAG: hypothetical protein HY529_03505 [Chloroflexi bacterium]|nr:hypothetical protein [Chloroflexota bacterium]
MTPEAGMSEELHLFIRENVEDYYSFQLLLFFARHPYTRFNELAIIHAFNEDRGRPHIKKALKELVGKGVVNMCTETNVRLYSLSEDDLCRRSVLNLARLDVYQGQLLLRQARNFPLSNDLYADTILWKSSTGLLTV